MTTFIFNVPLTLNDRFRAYLDSKTEKEMRLNIPIFFERTMKSESCFNMRESVTDNAISIYSLDMIDKVESKRLILSDTGVLVIHNNLSKENYLVGNMVNTFACEKHPILTILDELNASDIKYIFLSTERAPEFLNVEAWLHISVESKLPLHTIILKKNTKDRGKIDVFMSKTKTIFFSIYNGLFMYAPLFKFRNVGDLDRYMNETGLYLSRAIKALGQKKKSKSRARTLQNVKSWVDIVKDITENTKWDDKIERLVYNLLIGFDNKRFVDFNEIRIDPNIIYIVYDERQSTQLSLVNYENILRLKILKFMLTTIHDFYESNLYRHQKTDKKYTVAINTIEDNGNLIVNKTGRKLIDNPEISSFASIIEGTIIL